MGELTEDAWQAYLDTIAYRPGTPEWDSYVQDVLDLIEYANGDTNTEWGAKRAENGHPAPFGLKYLGLGNENWGDVYFRNLQALKEAIEKFIPILQLLLPPALSVKGNSLTLPGISFPNNMRTRSWTSTIIRMTPGISIT